MNDEVKEIVLELQLIEEGHTEMLDGNETVTDRLIILCYRLINIIYNMKGIK